jgi:tetratricopeptide (TPR) repeat protein
MWIEIPENIEYFTPKPLMDLPNASSDADVDASFDPGNYPEVNDTDVNTHEALESFTYDVEATNVVGTSTKGSSMTAMSAETEHLTSQHQEWYQSPGATFFSETPDFARRERLPTWFSPISVVPPLALSTDPSLLVSRDNGEDTTIISAAISEPETIGDHMQLAERLGAYGLTNEAIAQYLKAVSLCIDSRERNNMRLYIHEFNAFLKQEKTAAELKVSISATRQLITLLEESPFITDSIKIPSMATLGELLDRDGQLKEAETAYHRVLNIINDKERPEIYQTCKSALSKILYRTWSPKTEKVQQQLKNLSIHLQTITDGASLNSALGILIKLKSYFLAASIHHPCYQLGVEINSMNDLIGTQIWGQLYSFEMKIIRSSLAIAQNCSELGWQTTAESLLSSHRILLDKTQTRDWGYEKIRSYIETCAYFKSQQNWKMCIDFVETAYRVFEDLLYSRGREPYRKGDSPLLILLDEARSEIPAGDPHSNAFHLLESMQARMQKMIAWNEEQHRVEVIECRTAKVTDSGGWECNSESDQGIDENTDERCGDDMNM